MSTASLSRGQRLGPIATLLLLSPLIGEVMSGATRLSYIVVLVPEIMVWGCATLVIREAVRRWRAGWTSMLLLGLALSVAEEFIIQQTSIAPLPWMAADAIYGRVWGVNWPYFMFQLGYESVWIVLVPVLVTELIFPQRRDEPWLRTRGIVISTVMFLFGSFIAWFTWTQRALPNVFHVPVYHPPAVTIALALLSIVVLAVVAYAARGIGRTSSTRTPPRPWLVAVVALILGFPWYGLMFVVFGGSTTLPLWIPMVMASIWAVATWLVVGRWTTSSGWQDVHRWALGFGALLVCMLAGFLGSGWWTRTDTIAKAVMNLAAVACMVVLALRIARRPAKVFPVFQVSSDGRPLTSEAVARDIDEDA
jgi:hypothetical protein